MDEREPRPELVRRVDVFVTGRRIDAEMIRAMLEGHGLDARVWGSGMGSYRMESAMTEMTGIPNAFNSYRVGVLEEQAEEARSILAQVSEGEEIQSTALGELYKYRADSFMSALRSRWLLVAVALCLLAVIIFPLVAALLALTSIARRRATGLEFTTSHSRSLRLLPWSNHSALDRSLRAAIRAATTAEAK